MKKCTIVIIVLLYSFISANPLFAADTWTQKENFGGSARAYAVGFSIGSKGYIGTGKDASSYFKDFWEYDPAANTWTQKADFGGGERAYLVGFSIGSKGYVGTGYDNSLYKKDFWEYDPVTNTWTKKADFGGTARVYSVGFSIDSKGYIGTGMDYYANYFKDFWEYDPAADTWTKKADFGGSARYIAVGFSIGKRGYIGTGMDASGSGNKDFWEYNPTANTWTQKANFGGTARNVAAGFSISNKGYIGTGIDSSSYKKDFWEYSPATNAWMQRADFGGTARTLAIGFSIGSTGYIGTGWNGTSRFRDFWAYDPPDTTSPTVTRVTAKLNTNITSLPITITANDNVGITAYLVTASSTQPGSADSRWSSSNPFIYNLTSDGTYTLYGWAKDGAGNVSSAASSITVTVDTTIPTITFTNLTANAAGFPVADVITITFNEAMDASTINSSTFTVQSGTTSVAGTVSYDYSTLTTTFTPTAPLFCNRSFTAKLTTEVKDLAGNPLGARSWDFTTAISKILGDLNGDGYITMADVIIALQDMVALQPSGLRIDYVTSNADINGDGKEGLPELLYILQKLAGTRQ